MGCVKRHGDHPRTIDLPAGSQDVEEVGENENRDVDGERYEVIPETTKEACGVHHLCHAWTAQAHPVCLNYHLFIHNHC